MRRDALAIWQAGVDRVRADRLVAENVQVDGQWLLVGGEPIDLRPIRRVVVVGAGKAGAAMAAGLEQALGPRFLDDKQVQGWINVPEDCLRSLARIHLHAARPAAVNEPTEAGVRGSLQILRLVAELGPADLCLALISGGGSALLPAPREGISLADKLALTRLLSAAGATIHELNTVRSCLSRIKGGQLAGACRAGRLEVLVLSDVPGDPLEVIASGPTVLPSAGAVDALAVLERYEARAAGVGQHVFDVLDRPAPPPRPSCRVRHLVIGNNALAVDAAGATAERLGYSHAMIAAAATEGSAEGVGRRLAAMALHMRANPGPDCLVSGGEPTVQLVDPARRGRGGRNQQLVLAALEQFGPALGEGIVLLSGGTDGEDGPTDAAGAMFDPGLARAARQAGLNPALSLRRNDAYTFFESAGGLVRTGPTGTNVCDLRVVLVDRVELAQRASHSAPQSQRRESNP